MTIAIFIIAFAWLIASTLQSWSRQFREEENEELLEKYKDEIKEQ